MRTRGDIFVENFSQSNRETIAAAYPRRACERSGSDCTLCISTLCLSFSLSPSRSYFILFPARIQRFYVILNIVTFYPAHARPLSPSWKTKIASRRLFSRPTTFSCSHTFRCVGCYRQSRLRSLCRYVVILDLSSHRCQGCQSGCASVLHHFDTYCAYIVCSAPFFIPRLYFPESADL